MKRLIKYAIALIVGGALVYATLSSYGYDPVMTAVERYRILADACTIAGIPLFLSGVLVWLSGQGMFTGVRYTMGHLLRRLIPGLGGTREERYYDYLQRQKSKQKPHGYGFLFITGGAFLLGMTVFTILFYTVY